jgi:hypothetical protein
MVPNGRLDFPGLCGLVKLLLAINLESGRLGGGTERATEGGRLGGAFEEPRATTGAFVGEQALSMR